ncbi:RNA polymerase Rpb4 family protein [Methanococcus aeolicus]|uniref:DNA-directed RNA polymerase subunit Rpo4 n=1 Tax=Methanococcus aeolicus (strain ATCC BAA-1280 / DSM 17508 / OCM 812 / Nankai-3) TaxID=419665 RepID=A6UT26_META3|nr:RNA polymerase Rpb4 family protein [Methanococcus aeolicus]ABR55648.1 RNA polymerase Rpb4 [Methanococcus aeolicus Nankai-3]UXM85148.1 RNA polymerase Rpb4 family protein [Methanococcus aeolicus]
MIGNELISQKYITLSSAEELMSNKSSDDELSYENGCALDYLQRFAKLNAEDVEKLTEELKKLELDEKTIVKIIDILPEDNEDLKLIFYKSDIPKCSEDILDLCAKFR